MMLEPVQKRSGRSMKLNCADDHSTSSSEKRDRCIMHSAAAAQNSMTKSRSLTRVQRIAGRGVEAQQLRGVGAVDGEAGAGQRRRAQRHDVDAFAAVQQALVIAFQHFDPGQQMVPEAHRHGDLQSG